MQVSKCRFISPFGACQPSRQKRTTAEKCNSAAAVQARKFDLKESDTPNIMAANRSAEDKITVQKKPNETSVRAGRASDIFAPGVPKLQSGMR